MKKVFKIKNCVVPVENVRIVIQELFCNAWIVEIDDKNRTLGGIIDESEVEKLRLVTERLQVASIDFYDVETFVYT